MSGQMIARQYSLAELRRDIAEDILGHARHGADFYGHQLGFLRKLSIFFTPPMMCTALFRLSHWAWRYGYRRLAWGLGHLNQMLHGACLHPASRIGGGLYIPHTVGVIFEGHGGRNLVLFANAVVAAGKHHPQAWTGDEKSPLLGDDVTVGAYAVVSGRPIIGDRVRVAPCATVQHDVPADSMVVSANLTRIHTADTHPLVGSLHGYC